MNAHTSATVVGLLQRFQLAVWPDGAGRWRNVDRGPDVAARAR